MTRSARDPDLPAEDVLGRPVADLAEAVRQGACDARELLGRSRERIAQTDDELRAWVVLAAGEQAADRDAHRDVALAGIPLGVKDIIDVAGLPTRCGSPITSPDRVETTAPLVAELTSLGAVVVGKTVTTEFAYFAPGPTANPRDLGRTPGGSSSGSAAAVAAGHVPVALGSQTGGSTIRPASYCGIAGLVPPHGSTDLAGFLTLCPSLDVPGLFTRTVGDLVTVVDAMYPRLFHEAGPDDDGVDLGGADLVGVNPAAIASLADPTRGVTVRWWDGGGLDDVVPQMAAAVEGAVAVLRERGYDVSALDWDAQVQALSAGHVQVMAYEMADSLGPRLAAHPDRISTQLADLLRAGAAISESTYRDALDQRERYRRILADRLGAEQVILGPGAPGPAPLGLSGTGRPSMSRPWQLLGWPQLAVPGARTSDGLPLGLQLIGRPGQEDLLLALGLVLEQALATATDG